MAQVYSLHISLWTQEPTLSAMDGASRHGDPSCHLPTSDLGQAREELEQGRPPELMQQGVRPSDLSLWMGRGLLWERLFPTAEGNSWGGTRLRAISHHPPHRQGPASWWCREAFVRLQTVLPRECRLRHKISPAISGLTRKPQRSSACYVHVARKGADQI